MGDDRDIEHLLADLTASQRAAVTSDAAPLCIVASAGAGKTRVLTRRIAYRVLTGSADARHVLAITFTRKAAGELQGRLRGLGLRDRITSGTFHAIAAAQLQRWWADRRRRPPTLLDRKARLLVPLAAARPALSGVAVAELAGHIEWAKARLVLPDEFDSATRRAGRQLSCEASAVAALYARYEDEKVRRGLVDFDDLLLRCADALERDPQFAGAQRWRWRHIFVDEFQDLNPLQHRLLLEWLGASRDLCVVGDPNQAVYGWNGSDPGLLARMPERWPGTRVVRLEDNHRSTPQIVAAAAAVLGESGTRLRASGTDGPQPTVRSYPSDSAEADAIASDVVAAHAAGRPWHAVAVLGRTNAQLLRIQRALEAAGVPCWAPAQAALLEEPAAARVLDELRRDPGRPMQVVAADLAADAGPEGTSGGTALDDGGRAALAVLADLAVSFHQQDPGGVAGQWLAWLPAALRRDSQPGVSDAVTLCSFHRSKGLEWEEVWVAGLEEGLVPISRATSSAEQEEERRLLYVALTRAASHLHCSWARSRSFGGRPVARRPSPWLGALGPGGAGGEDGAGEGSAGAGEANAVDSSERWRRRLREQRSGLGERARLRRGAEPRLPPGWADPDPALSAALRAWRVETARASGVPIYAVLHDTTLSAVASRRPRTLEDLLSVPGLGPVKAARYGPTLLAIAAEQAGTPPPAYPAHSA